MHISRYKVFWNFLLVALSATSILANSASAAAPRERPRIEVDINKAIAYLTASGKTDAQQFIASYSLLLLELFRDISGSSTYSGHELGDEKFIYLNADQELEEPLRNVFIKIETQNPGVSALKVLAAYLPKIDAQISLANEKKLANTCDGNRCLNQLKFLSATRSRILSVLKKLKFQQL